MQKANVFSRWISSANCAHSITMSKEAFLRTCLAIRSDMQASSLLGSLTRPTKFRLRSSSSHNMLRCSTHHTVSTAPSYGLAECMRRVPSWQLKTPFSDQWSAPGKWVMGRKLLGAIAWSLTLQQCMPLRWVKVFGTRKSTDFCPLITPKCEGNKDAKSGILPYCNTARSSRSAGHSRSSTLCLRGLAEHTSPRCIAEMQGITERHCTWLVYAWCWSFLHDHDISDCIQSCHQWFMCDNFMYRSSAVQLQPKLPANSLPKLSYSSQLNNTLSTQFLLYNLDLSCANDCHSPAL